MILAGVGLALLLGPPRHARGGQAGRATSPRPPSTSPARATSRGGSRPAATTSSRAWPRASTRCSRRSSDSQRAQRQLVADASHELRTPLTSLRTNLEVLSADGASSTSATARGCARDVVGQLERADRARLGPRRPRARGGARREREEVRLDELVAGGGRARGAARARHALRLRARADARRRRAGAARPRGGEPARQRRQVEPAGRRRSTCGCATASCRCATTGPGIADEDLPFVFDRFYRAPGARGRPGSGLGLAIVRQVAEAHGGGVEAGAAPGGGALLALRAAGRRRSGRFSKLLGSAQEALRAGGSIRIVTDRKDRTP